ncbi:MAG: hypothetical protein VKI42_01715 [Synechococcaceae cyanobacterium]|nr:hypothetical protein [Synechococcaceae cyanobacterium]
MPLVVGAGQVANEGVATLDAFWTEIAVVEVDLAVLAHLRKARSRKALN